MRGLTLLAMAVFGSSAQADYEGSEALHKRQLSDIDSDGYLEGTSQYSLYLVLFNATDGNANTSKRHHSKMSSITWHLTRLLIPKRYTPTRGYRIWSTNKSD
ncbi:uncharacterized protein B0P05DRAFT_590331 [Gilbertella persicaria]|uniref:uncharacterized protein n=1 Tax=Gilbertella persicaria TaxID=101096 RepID=UPI002220B849|nr:uncharacterized protein B0P05DRAFT_590331 [Gilbertella persicaria]KAI8063396.1 hypothetical protein B0P05DRAFT_590331 [Gilbertella persicaria]